MCVCVGGEAAQARGGDNQFACLFSSAELLCSAFGCLKECAFVARCLREERKTASLPLPGEDELDQPEPCRCLVRFTVVFRSSSAFLCVRVAWLCSEVALWVPARHGQESASLK